MLCLCTPFHIARRPFFVPSLAFTPRPPPASSLPARPRAPSSSPPPVPPTSQEYFQCASKDHSRLRTLYHADALLSVSVTRPDQTVSASDAQGQSSIMTKLTSERLLGCRIRLLALSAQPSLAGSILLTVHGVLTSPTAAGNATPAPKREMIATFALAASQPGASSYVIRNHMLQFSSVEATGDAAKAPVAAAENAAKPTPPAPKTSKGSKAENAKDAPSDEQPPKAKASEAKDAKDAAKDAKDAAKDDGEKPAKAKGPAAKAAPAKKAAEEPKPAPAGPPKPKTWASMAAAVSNEPVAAKPLVKKATPAAIPTANATANAKGGPPAKDAALENGIYVSGLPAVEDDAELSAMVTSAVAIFGEVTHVRVMGRAPGAKNAVVSFASAKEAAAARAQGKVTVGKNTCPVEERKAMGGGARAAGEKGGRGGRGGAGKGAYMNGGGGGVVRGASRAGSGD